MPLTRAQPLLQHIIVAASAAHMSNLLRPPMYPMAQPDGVITYPNAGQASKRALKDALVAKHKALRLMHTAVQNIATVGVDVVLAAALFFINVELIESGKHGWKAHLEGVGKMMAMLPPSDNSTRELRDYMLSDCFSYFVLASAFMAATSTIQSYFESDRIPTVLQRVTDNSYICCPPRIMEILYSATQLSNVRADDEESKRQVAMAGAELLHQAQSFDMLAWAAAALNTPHLRDVPLQSRVNVGTAHQLAACLYIVQAIPELDHIVGPNAAEDLHSSMFKVLAKVPPEDPNFKSTTWPTFVFAAGATEPEKRAMAMDRLLKLVQCCPWGFIYTAMETLQVLWHLDQGRKGGKTWIQTLKDPELNFLIV